MLSFEEAADLMDEIAEGFPPEFFETLNGGILFLPEEKLDPDVPGELYVMGEYCHDALGRYINLYFGSFSALAQLEDWDRETWEAELRTTLSHELTHHMEQRSGLHALDDRDAEELAAWRQEYENGDSAR